MNFIIYKSHNNKAAKKLRQMVKMNGKCTPGNAIAWTKVRLAFGVDGHHFIPPKKCKHETNVTQGPFLLEAEVRKDFYPLQRT